ncbi:MAG: SDR family oxidoreductase [Solirubrobacterales bacterium]|nr:SDR family oxidoreductase [Solirubrobacterales bacterium]
MSTYANKTVLITGGSSGFGLETARLLISSGARVMITGRSQQKLDDAAQRLGPGVVVVLSDTASPADIDTLANRVEAEFHRLDLLFLNAGVTRYVPFKSMDDDTYDEIFAVNAKGPYFTAQRLAPLIREGGSIVLTTSVSNVKGLPMISAYAAAKAALRSMTRSLARELLPDRIRVNAVSPGPIDTGILERALPEEAATQTRRQLTASNPMGRFGNPAEVARAVIFLAFDATYTTGAELPVDGGGSQL